MQKQQTKKRYLVFPFLLLLNFVSHFVLFKQMGLYEDDYSFIAKAINWQQSQINQYIVTTLFNAWPQGRPLGFIIPRLAAYLSPKDAPLVFLYLFGALVITINAFLCYKFVLFWSKNETIAFIAAMSFSLFPADTTKSLLIHIYHIQVSMLFILLAINIFLRYPKYRVIAYILGILSLLTYETPYALIFLLPIFTEQKKQKRFWITHLIISFSIVIFIILIRTLMGESRIASVSLPIQIMAQIIASMVIGPVVSFGLFFYGPARTVLHMNKELYVVMGISFIILTLMIWLYFRNNINVEESGVIKNIKMYSIEMRLPEWVATWMNQLILVTLWLCTAYLFAFSHFPPVVRYGRGTSVHISATIPASLLFSLFIYGIWRILKTKKIYKYAYIFLLSAYFSVTVGNQFSIQQDFVKSWAYQQKFWQQVLQLTPDVQEGTIVFVVNHNLPEEHYIISNSWADYFIYGELVEFPSDWKQLPMVLVTNGDWEKTIVDKNGQYYYPWNIYWNFLVESGNIILLTDDANGNLIRVDDSIHLLGDKVITSLSNNYNPVLQNQFQHKELYKVMTN